LSQLQDGFTVDDFTRACCHNLKHVFFSRLIILTFPDWRQPLSSPKVQLTKGKTAQGQETRTSGSFACPRRLRWKQAAISVDSDGAETRFPAAARHNSRFCAWWWKREPSSPYTSCRDTAWRPVSHPKQQVRLLVDNSTAECRPAAPGTPRHRSRDRLSLPYGVLSLPFTLRYRLAYDAHLIGDVLHIFVQAVFGSLRRRSGFLASNRKVRRPANSTSLRRISKKRSLSIRLNKKFNQRMTVFYREVL
jgi:hypothetical protein